MTWFVKWTRVPTRMNTPEVIITEVPTQLLLLTGRDTKRPELFLKSQLAMSVGHTVDMVYRMKGEQKVVHYEDGQLRMENYISKELAALVQDRPTTVRAD